MIVRRAKKKDIEQLSILFDKYRIFLQATTRYCYSKIISKKKNEEK